MSINIVVYILLLLGFVFFLEQKGDKAKMKFIIYCSLVLVLKAALRSVTIGSDTSHYSAYFYQSMDTSWSEIFNFFVINTGINDIEPGYRLIEKVFSSIISDFNLFTFFVQSTLYYLPLGILMYKKTKSTKELLFGYVLLNALFSGLPMANARQVYSIGFCVWSYMFIENKKYLYALICILVGYTIHHSALLFLLMLVVPLISYKIFKITIWATIFIAPLIMNNANKVILFMANAISNDKYMGYAEYTLGGAITYISLSLGLCLFAAIALNKCTEDEYTKKIYYAIVSYSALFTPLIYSNGSMIRITMYFQLFFVMLIPKLIEVYFPTNKKIIYSTLILILMILSVINEGEYKFFWEENQDPLINWT